MKRISGFSTAGDVAQAPAAAGHTAPAGANRAERRRRRREVKHRLPPLTLTARLSLDELAYHAAERWVDDDQVGRRHTRLFHDFSAKGTGLKIGRTRQWTSHGFAELEAAQVFRQLPQPRNPENGKFTETRPKVLGPCGQFWETAKAKYAYLCLKAHLPIRNKTGKIISQDPKQTVAEEHGQLPKRPGRPRAVPDPSTAAQWADMTEAQRRWALQFNLPGFTPPG